MKSLALTNLEIPEVNNGSADNSNTQQHFHFVHNTHAEFTSLLPLNDGGDGQAQIFLPLSMLWVKFE